MLTKRLLTARFVPTVLAFFFLASFSTSAAAAVPDLLGGLSSLSGALDPLFSAARGMLSALVPVGWTFLSIALVLEAFTLVLTFWIKGGASEAIAQLARLLLLTSIPMTMLTTWPDLPNALMSGFTSEISKVITGGSGDGTDQISQTITTISQAFLSGMASATPPNSDAGMITGAIINALIAIMLFLPLTLFIVALLFALYGPLLLLYLGIITGPMLVPWLVWKPMDGLASKWLNFMLTSGVAFVVGLIMAKMVAAGLASYGNVVANAAKDGAFSAIMAAVAGMIPMVAMLLFAGYMLLKCESIGSALVGGASVGAGGGLFGAGMGALRHAGRPGGNNANKPGTSGSNGGGGSGGGTGGSGSAPGSASGAGGGGSGQPSSQASLSQQAGSASAASSKPSASAGSGAAGSTSTKPSSGGGGGGGAAGAASLASSPSATSSTSGTSASTSGAGSAAASSSSPVGEPSAPATAQAGEPAAQAGGGGAKPSRFSAAMTVARNAGEKIMSNPAGKYVAVGAAAAAAGPVGALAAGAYALSPKLRANTGKAMDKVGELGGKASRALSDAAKKK